MRSHEGICRRVSFGQRRRRRRMPGRRGACRRSRWCRRGTERKTAAGSCGTDRQRLRDRVHRHNAEGLKGLSGRRPAGPAPRLSPAQKAEPARMVREGPDLAAERVVRWRRAGPLSAGSKRAPAPPWTSAGWASSWPRPVSPAAGAPAAPEIRSCGAGGVQENLAATVTAAPPDHARDKPLGDVVPGVRHGAATGQGPMADARVGQQGTLSRIRAPRGSRPGVPRDTRHTSPGPACPAPFAPNAEPPRRSCPAPAPLP